MNEQKAVEVTMSDFPDQLIKETMASSWLSSLASLSLRGRQLPCQNHDKQPRGGLHKGRN